MVQELVDGVGHRWRRTICVQHQYSQRAPKPLGPKFPGDGFCRNQSQPIAAMASQLLLYILPHGLGSHLSIKHPQPRILHEMNPLVPIRVKENRLSWLLHERR